MTPPAPRGAVVLACRDLAANQRFFTALGFRLEALWPADDPRCLVLDGFGLCVRLERSESDARGELVLPPAAADAAADGAEPSERTAPNGTRVRFTTEPAALPPPLRAPGRVLLCRGAAVQPTVGRAGMLYHELVPGRLGGALAAARIRKERGGPIDDAVHHHRLAAHVLHGRSGWARVAYEGQREPFVLGAGDTVLQPPTIRHRVLECSDGFEAIEVVCPAEHATCFDADGALPAAAELADAARTWAGQRFAWHRLSDERPPRRAIVTTGIGTASGGRVDVRVFRSEPDQPLDATELDAGGTALLFVLRGQFVLRCADETLAMGEDDACVLPAGPVTLTATWPSSKLLEVRLAVR